MVKTTNRKGLFYGFMSLLMALTFVNCVNDNEDTEAPFLNVSPAELTFGTDGKPLEGNAVFRIETNRVWKATVKDDKTWVTLSQYSGEGSADVSVSIPQGINDEASVVIEMSNKIGTLLSKTVTIRSGNVTPSVVIYNENFGPQGGKVGDRWLFVDQYTEWAKTGEGASTVTYKGSGASIRNSGKLSEVYEGASGNAKLFFGSSAYFEVQKITLTENRTNLSLTFGGSYSKNTNGTYDNEFKKDNFKVYLSADGTTWSDAVDYSLKKAGDYWVLATFDFTLAKALTSIYIKFEAAEASVFSIDDVTLKTGQGGTVLTLEGGTTTPTEAQAITIPELIAKMTATQTPVDDAADRYFEAVVQNDTLGNNFSATNLFVVTPGSTAEKNGLVLYDSRLNPKTLKVNKGDRIKVTLHKGLAKTVDYKGLYEVTGSKDAQWFTVEKLGTTATVTPVTITYDKLKDYQAMTVTIAGATPEQAGTWQGGKTQTFKVDANTFPVYCNNAASFVNQPYAAVTGNITGIATVYNNTAQLLPRDAEDVKAFVSLQPTISAVQPSSLTFEAAGGTKTVDVTVANQGSHTLTATGLSGTLSATVNGNTVTVTATQNTGAAVSQTLTITVSGGNSIEVPVKQEAPVSGNAIVLTKDNIVGGKTGTVTLNTNGYGTQKVDDTATWYTWAHSGFNFTGVKICIAPDSNGGGIQLQANQGRIANVSEIKEIQTIEIVLKTKTTYTSPKEYSLYLGTSANPTENAIRPISTYEDKDGFRVYTQKFDVAAKGTFNFFNIMNDKAGALYIDSIKITYKP